MQKRMRFCLAILVLLINTAGCTSTYTAAPEVKIQHTATKPLEKFDEAVGRETETNKTSNDKTDTESLKGMEDLDMKHWKYNRDLQAAREASQQIQQSQSAVKPTQQNTSDINARNSIGQGNNSNGTGSYSPAKIDLLTEGDFQKAVSQLIKLGYLNETGINEQSFKEAVSQFQKEQGLKSSGQLDTQTLKSLSTKTNR